MKTKTHIKAGAGFNHNQTLVQITKPSAQPGKTTGLKVQTRIKAGSTNISNHNQTLVRAKAR